MEVISGPDFENQALENQALENSLVLGSSLINQKAKRSSNIYMLTSIIIHFVAHFFGIIGLINVLQGRVLASTVIFAIILADLGALGTTIGAHRLWSHKSFKAKTPLKILLVFWFSLAGQGSLDRWILLHRLHHKHVDTDGDPHNSTRGFFYSHIGWILTYDHAKLLPYAEKMDMSDIKNDPVVMWHKKNYVKYWFLPSIVLMPMFISTYFFGESVFNAFCVAACLKYMYISHRTFLINSVAHMWGSQPYDKKLSARNNIFATFFAMGEGWHNYHHAFPRDYKTSELGLYRLNISAALIDFFAWIGWAYDLKKAFPEAVLRRVERTGDKALHENQILS